MQIIALALIQGVLIFAVVAYFVGPDDKQATPVITMVGLGFSVVCLLLSFLVPQRMAAVLNRRAELSKDMGNPPQPGQVSDAAWSRFFPIYQTCFIVGMALLEGPAFFCLIAYFVEGHLFAFAIAAMLVMAMVIRFPLADRIEQWIERRVQVSQIKDQF